MWLENLKELKKAKGMTTKQIADATKIPESTIKRIFSGDTDNPYVDTVRRIAIALDSTLDEIFAETKVVVATETLAEVKENTEVVEAERDLVSIENEKLKIEIDALKNDLTTRETRIKLLELELQHKEELLKVHDFYNKILSRE